MSIKAVILIDADSPETVSVYQENGRNKVFPSEGAAADFVEELGCREGGCYSVFPFD